jgi:peptidoglycan/LPS O-acetylase OafA/YrhL
LHGHQAAGVDQATAKFRPVQEAGLEEHPATVVGEDRLWATDNASSLRSKGTIAPLTHRDDIQGLRAVAVLLVALNHAGVGFLAGGFVGVDVFFVLSGFLITSILLSDAAKHGRISLAGFYARRARRILPAAALTLIVTTLVANQLLNYVRASQAVWDSVWAALFAANINFANQGTDYFSQGQPPSPVQHYWSLSVEEQFYLVWPALLSLVVFGLVLSRRANARRQIAEGRLVITEWATRRMVVVVILITGASLFWSIYDTNMVPAAAYFSTFARAWELGLGAALAICSSNIARLPPAVRGLIGWVGLGAIAAAATTYSAATPFPGYAALLPTLGTALVIAAGVGRRERSRLAAGRLLAVSPLRYVGDRSYAFYLWHWPVLVVAAEYEGHELPMDVKLALLTGAFLLSMISYRFVEDPIRRARWRSMRSLLLIPASVGAVVIVAMLTLAGIDREINSVEQASAAGVSRMATQSLQTGQATAQSQVLPAVVAAVEAARRGDKIPSILVPPVSKLLNDSYGLPNGCEPAPVTGTTSNICRLGDASSAKSIVVFGDSHASMWMPTILNMAQRDGWVVIPLIKTGCSPNGWTGPGYSDYSAAKLRACHAWYQWAVAQAKRLRPAVTLIAGCCTNQYPDNPVSIALINGFSTLAKTMQPYSQSVVVIADDDGIAKDPVDCLLAPHATMKTCTTTQPDAILAYNNHLAEVANADNFGFLWTRGWFCYQKQCPMVVDDTIVYRDTGHITQTYALRLNTAFREAFRQCIFDACAPPS